jgi:hypothetical protein
MTGALLEMTVTEADPLAALPLEDLKPEDALRATNRWRHRSRQGRYGRSRSTTAT